MAKATKRKKRFNVTSKMFHSGGQPGGGVRRLMFAYAQQFLASLKWEVLRLHLGMDDPLKQECTGTEHRQLLTRSGPYPPSAVFKVTTRRGLKRFMCWECVELLAMAVYEKDRGRISELWAQMLPELL